MKLAVFTVSLPEYTPEQAVQKLAGWGYDGIEWRVTDDPLMSGNGPTMAGHGVLSQGQVGFWSGNRCTLSLSSLIKDVDFVQRIRAMTEQAGLEIPNIGTYVSCEEPELVEQAMLGVKALGAPALRVRVPNYDGKQPYLKLRDNAVAQYRDVAAMAKQHGVQAMIEVHMNNIVPSASAAAHFASNFDPRYVGIIHDAGNMVYEGYEQYRLGFEVLGPYLAHVHLKNAQWQITGTREDGSTEWKPTWAPIQKGSVDLRRLLDALHAVGYDGWLAFEDFSTEQPVDVRTQENLAYIKRLL